MKTVRTLIRVVATLSVALAASAPSATSWAATPAHSSGGGITRAGHGLASLGDSVAAGYFAGPADHTDYATECGRTTSAYGYQVGRITGRTVRVLACAGATSAVGLLGPQGPVPAQLEQLRALSSRPSAVTLTIGANDVQQGYFLGLCLSPDIDCATDANTEAFHGLLHTVAAPNLKRALAELVETQHIRRVLLTGYYDPFGSLAPQLGLQPGEIDWYRARLGELNGMLRAQASSTRHVTFVSLGSLDAAKGDIQVDPTRQGFIHPTERGQRKIAAVVAQRLCR